MVYPVIRWHSQACNPAEHHGDGVGEDERQWTQTTSHSYEGPQFLSACMQSEVGGYNELKLKIKTLKNKILLHILSNITPRKFKSNAGEPEMFSIGVL